MSGAAVRCPGCGLEMPSDESAAYDGYCRCTPECWSVYTEVLGTEFGNAVLFGRVHQMTVDACAVQHAGGAHPDRSVGIHLTGLHLVLERGFPPVRAPPLHGALAAAVEAWPRLPPPPNSVGDRTVLDVALSDGMEAHARNVRAWAREVWDARSGHHGRVAALVSRHLDLGQGPRRGRPGPSPPPRGWPARSLPWHVPGRNAAAGRRTGRRAVARGARRHRTRDGGEQAAWTPCWRRSPEPTCRGKRPRSPPISGARWTPTPAS